MKKYNASQMAYSSWRAMRSRCLTKTHTAYKFYGGKGVKICDQWDEFSVFLYDMGEKPTKKHTIDRIDSSGDYTPENCRWATQKEQIRNRGKNKNNTSGEVGVSWSKERRKWIASITVDNKAINLGGFVNFQKAKAVRLAAVAMYWG